jgi:outer membrane protein assembly factor BamE
MQKKLLVLVLGLGLFLSGCSLVHKRDIEQGNIIQPDMVQRLHKGMTKEQVQEVMGTPVLINTFNDNRIDYVYTFKRGGGKMTEKRVSLVFSKGRLREINEVHYGPAQS